ncbi:MAG: hypothetical protein QM770_02640 [Tepidisphaeraceae bacterium]
MPSPGNESGYNEHREVYRDLILHYPIAWQQVADYPMGVFANPDIIVLKIDKGPIR